MAVQRIFLDWNRPCLPQAAEWLIGHSQDQSSIDLRHLRVVLPGARALRRLMELLVDQGELHKKVLIPPYMMTSGSLPEELYESSNRLAYSFERHMAWLQALEECSPEELEQLLPRAPQKNNVQAWFLLAQRLDKLYAEIASGGHSFADVAEHCQKNHELFPDQRWEILASLYSAFSDALAAHGLADVHAERMRALAESRCECRGEIVLIGTSDLPLLTRRMLLQNSGRCSSLVHAGNSKKLFESYFDELGCVIPEKWTDFEIPLAEDCIEFARNPSQQAAKVLHAIADLQETIAPEAISIGNCSKEAKPYLVEALQERQIPLADATGVPLDRTSPILFLKLSADYLQSRTFAHFANLIRHPEVQAAVLDSPQLKALNNTGHSLLSILDQYQQEHVQAELPEKLPGGNERSHVPTLARNTLHDILGELLHGPRNLAQWAPAIANTLVKLFGKAPLHPHEKRDALILSACSALHDEISKLHSFSPAKGTKVSASEAIRLLLSQLAGSTVDLGGTDAAIEILGWLELQLDDASAIFITSMNEGYAPETITADPFLPNSLRSALGLLDNERRFARDAYALSAICTSCQQLKVLATRLDAQGSPLRPSRLLFACSGKEIAVRIKNFFGSTQESAATLENEEGAIAALLPPKPEKLSAAPAKMAVTAFRDYIACPYRFYLKHILKLRSIDDNALELDAAASGTILHAVLTSFGLSRLKDETSERKINDFLLQSLEEKYHEQFGNSAMAAVKVQRLQTEARLKAFSTWQAQWRASGWAIKHVELAVEGGALELPHGGAMQLQGRIDRIDFNAQSGELMVLDYKAGDKGDGPLQAHQHKGEWINLQLPLYHHMLRATGTKEALRLGYILLPADLEKTGVVEAAWPEQDIESALILAKTVAQAVHDQIFWPPKDLRRSDYDDYRILLPEDFSDAINAGTT